MNVNPVSFKAAAFVKGTPKAAAYIADIANSPKTKKEDAMTTQIREVFNDVDKRAAFVFPFNEHISFIFSGKEAERACRIISNVGDSSFTRNEAGTVIASQTGDYVVNHNMWIQAKLYSTGCFETSTYDARTGKVNDIKFVKNKND